MKADKQKKPLRGYYVVQQTDGEAYIRQSHAGRGSCVSCRVQRDILIRLQAYPGSSSVFLCGLCPAMPAGELIKAASIHVADIERKIQAAEESKKKLDSIDEERLFIIEESNRITFEYQQKIGEIRERIKKLEHEKESFLTLRSEQSIVKAHHDVNILKPS